MHFRSFGRHNDSDTVCLASAGFMTGGAAFDGLLVRVLGGSIPAPGVAALAAVPWLGALAAGQADAAALAGGACVCPAGRGAGVQLLRDLSGV